MAASMSEVKLRLLQARTAISRELRTNNDNLGFDTASEARAAILLHRDWRERWPDFTKELSALADEYRDAYRALCQVGGI